MADVVLLICGSTRVENESRSECRLPMAFVKRERAEGVAEGSRGKGVKVSVGRGEGGREANQFGK